uniref:Uncharacterized protein n=2 Tax=Ixodes scapularis TaxID=6945 RepID=A0A1S4KN33_IXOSC
MQISTLVSAKDKALRSEQAARARVGQAVNLAVERFVSVGEAIADDNIEIKLDMYDACRSARAAGTTIEQLCDVRIEEGTEAGGSDRGAMARAAKVLLASVTRVLLLADTVVVKQLLSAKDRVRQTPA